MTSDGSGASDEMAGVTRDDEGWTAAIGEASCLSTIGEAAVRAQGLVLASVFPFGCRILFYHHVSAKCNIYDVIAREPLTFAAGSTRMARSCEGGALERCAPLMHNSEAALWRARFDFLGTDG